MDRTTPWSEELQIIDGENRATCKGARGPSSRIARSGEGALDGLNIVNDFRSSAIWQISLPGVTKLSEISAYFEGVRVLIKEANE